MSEPTLVFPPDSSERSQDASYSDGPSVSDAERLRHLLASTSTRGGSPNQSSESSSVPIDDPNDFSFSFNEEDLIPKKTSWSGSHRNEFYEPVVDPSDLSNSSSTFYSTAPDLPAESKITVQRTLYVSEQQKAAAQKAAYGTSQPQSKPTPPIMDAPQKARPEKKAITNFARKQRPVRTASPSPEKRPIEAPRRRESPDRAVGAAQDKIPERARADKDDRAEKSSFRRTRSLLGRRNKLASPELRTDGANKSGPNTPPRNASPSKRPITPMFKTMTSAGLAGFGLSGRRSTDVPPVPASVDADKYKATTTSQPKKRDELWAAFRSLEADAVKFAAKPVGSRTFVAKMTLLPFLKNYAKHPSNKSLRAEDVDRRTAILNKWWSGLLELLSAKNYHLVSGSDRPILLDSIVLLMERPEWRAYPSAFCPLAERLDPPTSTSSDGSRPALTTETSEFVIESVQHNVRNIFVQNIFSQMRFAVDKMCLRSTPVSLVAFCGKTCAYAFFFCPGIADILIRLWDIRPQNIQRILRANGMRRGSRLPDFSETIASNFPQNIRHLAFSSLKTLSQNLKETPTAPLGVENVPWHGHWTHRWSGGDSDLFYVFVKNFHVLLCDYLPVTSSKEERLSAPAVLLVHAQLLNNLDTTIHRGTMQSNADTESPTTFEGLLAADDNASPVQTPPANAGRLMAENRLTLLLRDSLLVKAPSANFFAESFSNILKAAAESTSLYNQDSCFTLCDFLQETFAILIRFQLESTNQQPLLDWPFWLQVFKRMVSSQSTTTEIRLYAFIFTTWNDLTAMEDWKRQLCLDFFLEPMQFYRSFNHWCPMVRTYFMRILCWRLARYDGDATETDLDVLSTLLKRLQTVWSHHKYTVLDARKKGQLLPSTAPCNPAPGRKLLIIRTDNPLSSSLMMTEHMTLSGSSSDSNRPDSPPPDSVADSLSQSATSFFDRITSGLESIDSPKKRGSLFRSLLGYKTSDSPTRSQSPQASSDDAASDSPNSSRETSPERKPGSRTSMYEQRPPLPPPKGSLGPPKPPAKGFVPAFFKFSLEAVDRRPHNLPTDIVLSAPRLPLAAQVLLASQDDFKAESEPQKPMGDAALQSRYAGRALAEWTWVVNECQNFFERRRNEGVQSNKQVETPTLGVETFRKPN